MSVTCLMKSVDVLVASGRTGGRHRAEDMVVETFILALLLMLVFVGSEHVKPTTEIAPSLD